MFTLLWFIFIILQVADSTKALYDKDLHADQHGNHTSIQPREDTITVNLDARGLTSVIIQTPRFPMPFPPRLLINWSVQGTCDMEVFCPSFNLLPRNRRGICRDYLEIKDGNSTERFCGNELDGKSYHPLIDRPYKYQLYLTFKSSSKGNGKYDGLNCTVSCFIPTTITPIDPTCITPPDNTTKDIIPCYCGVYTPPVKDNHKIVGGQTAEDNQFPWQAVIVWYGTSTDDRTGLLCGGSLINDQWVLTAAHCTDHLDEPKANQIQVFLGAYCWTDQPAGLRVFDVVEVIQHPHYDPDILDNDISLLKLDTRIDFCESQFRPVCLPITNTDPIPDEDDVSAAISGFGTLAYKGSLPDCLQYAIVETMNNTECQTKYSPGWITPNMICAAFPNRDACQGDSGGPMQTNATSAIFGIPFYVQIGIVSWGIDCAHHEYPGVYARVSEYINWIHDNAEWSSAYTCPAPF